MDFLRAGHFKAFLNEVSGEWAGQEFRLGSYYC